MNRLLTILFLFTIAFLSSCSKDEKATAQAYFGGEIINPKEKHVILFKDEIAIDTLLLDSKNRFYYSFKSLEPGLYSFVHNEFQYVYIEPSDSIFLRLNTLEFDESLTFTGKGALKNNFLIKSFLQNEQSSDKWHEAIYKNTPQDFKKHLENEQERRLNNLHRYSDKYLFSDNFKSLAKVNIDYHYYGLLEQYPLYNKMYNDSLNQDYYSFRNHTQLNQEKYISLYPYWNYLYAFTDNITKKEFKSNNYQLPYKESLLKYTQLNLEKVDSLIKNQELKNMVLNRAAKKYMTKANNEQDAAVILDLFSKYNTSSENKEKLSKLVHCIKRLEYGNKIPNVTLVNRKNQETNIHHIINQPTIVYFWSSRYPKHFNSVQQRIKDYTHNSPYNFIGISIDENKNKWNEHLNKVPVNPNYELIFLNHKEASDNLLLHQIHKVFVLDENAKILNSNLNIFDPKFEEKISNLSH